MRLHFEKISRYDRTQEPCTAALPFAEGEVGDPPGVSILDRGRPLPLQSRVTSRWPDGSVRWLLVHFMVDLPGNAPKDLDVSLEGTPSPEPDQAVSVEDKDGSYILKTGEFEVGLTGAAGLFESIRAGGFSLDGGAVTGPMVVDADGKEYICEVPDGGWQVVESGPVRAVVETSGSHRSDDGEPWMDYEARIYAFAGKPWLRLDYRVINREDAPEALLAGMGLSFRPEGTGSNEEVRCAIGRSNYGTAIEQNAKGAALEYLIDADHLIYEANEQVAETNYGTYFADWNGPEGGFCATIHQAFQNFPKALRVDGGGIDAALLPKSFGGLNLIQGMAKTHRLFIHLHGPEESLEDINVRSLQFQMPDHPSLDPEAYRAAGVFSESIWVERKDPGVERFLIHIADRRTRAYGILHWGDGPDAGYTEQGRGKGELVWTNNEYDLPHAAMLMYARTAERRMRDYMLISAEHWMDVDICHHSDDPLRYQGQTIHSARHAVGGVTPSHEWVEGLLDYYHQTGEGFALSAAMGIAENVLRQMETPMFRTAAGSQARETGWALRSLVAMYRETNDPKWLEPAEFIVNQFDEWRRQYGAWLAPYTSHSLVRVPFMISIAAASLMRYYQVRPEERVKDMIVSAAKDLIEHCLMPDGSFYYKELPSLKRRGAGTYVLEAMAYAWELTGDSRFLDAGMVTFRRALGSGQNGGYSGPKFTAGDAVVVPGGPGPKRFASAFTPVMAFYAAAARAGIMPGE